ncbi:MAG TPA: hypothetical protein VMV46_05755, partial [Thermoanaerobaculia bacterium]|nr:hypothetical protein [Thermoanaerobaculia bacterium]
RARRPLAVAGPAPLARRLERRAILAALAALGVPLYAEAASQLAPGSSGEGTGPARLDGLAACFGVAAVRAALRPDLVLQLGSAPTVDGWEAAVERWCAAGDAEHVVLGDDAWPDPVSTAAWMVQGPPAAILAALAAGAGEGALARDPRWLETLGRWSDAGLRVAAEVTEVAADDGGAGRLGEPAAVRAVLEELPDRALLALGNSLPIRTAEVFGPPGAGARLVWSQRGANGIDGLVSGVAGSLAAWEEGRGDGGALGVLVVGDVSLRHDLGGLAVLRHLGGARLLIALIDNGGGRIFDQLPAHRLDLGERWRFWSTPDGVSWPALASTFGLDYHEAGDPATVRAAMREWRAASGSALLRVTVDPESARLAAEELRRRLTALAPGSAASAGPAESPGLSEPG